MGSLCCCGIIYSITNYYYLATCPAIVSQPAIAFVAGLAGHRVEDGECKMAPTECANTLCMAVSIALHSPARPHFQSKIAPCRGHCSLCGSCLGSFFEPTTKTHRSRAEQRVYNCCDLERIIY